MLSCLGGLAILLHVVTAGAQHACADDLTCTVPCTDRQATANRCLGSVCICTAPSALVVFEQFKRDYNRIYPSKIEEQRRRAIFAANVAENDKTNRKGLSYTVGVTKFTDLTAEEFRSQYLMDPSVVAKARAQTQPTAVHKRRAQSLADLPSSVDWVKKGAVGAVKDQGQCGSCWIFATTGALEGARQIVMGGPVVSLSEEQWMACDKSEPCNGGIIQDALKYAKNASICTEASFPYIAPSGKPYPPPPPLICNASTCGDYGLNKGQVTNVTSVTKKSELDLLDAVSMAPVAVSVDGSALAQYKSGILSGHCAPYPDLHAMLVVGYGTENGVDYWNLKNSYGSTWGESGYMRVMRNDSKCKNYGTGGIGILMDPTYPVVAAAGGW